MKSILIIGMGKFGTQLGSKLMELGNEVMIVDKDEAIIDELAPHFTEALIGDCSNDGVLKSIGVNNFDICVVAIGDDFQSSLEITSRIKELGAKYVISKAEKEVQAKFLLRNGADEIVYPERDIALKLAIKCNAQNVFDFIEITSDYAIFEIAVPKKWSGNSVIDLNVRSKYNINIIAIKDGASVNPVFDPNYVFSGSEHLIVLGNSKDIYKLSKAK